MMFITTGEFLGVGELVGIWLDDIDVVVVVVGVGADGVDEKEHC